MSCGIYKITNLINGKNYIGQSINIQERWRHHRSNNIDTPLYRAFKKYGLENFSFEILEECSKDQLNDKEKYYIKKYNSYLYWENGGYNLTTGGEGRDSSPNKLSFQQVQEIYQKLLENKLSNIEIAQTYNVSENTISGINTGYYWYNDIIDYPVRKKNIKYCPKCGKRIKNNVSYCSDCFHKLQRKVERPDKESLFKILLDNKGNFSQIARQFNVTDNTIRKWCKGYQMPFHSSDYNFKK